MYVKKAISSSIILFVLATVVLTGISCGGGTPETIVIGLTAPLSGSGAQYGTDVQTGIEIAISDINESGGAKVKGDEYNFELVALDDKADPEIGVRNASRLVSEEGASVVFCPVATVIYPLEDINEKRGQEFLIMAYTSVGQVADEGNQLLVTLAPPFTVYVRLFSELAMMQGWTRLGMVQTTGTYGDAWEEAMELTWQGAGGKVTGKARPDYYSETDFVPFLTDALKNNPDVLLVGGPTEPTAVLVEQAKGLGYQGGFIVMDQAKIDQMASQIGMDKMENCIGVAPVEEPFPGTKEFAERYRKKYDQPVSWETAICYTATWMLKMAVESADDFTDPHAIREAVPEALPMSGEEYPVEFDGIEPRGLMHMPTAITMVKSGEFTMADQLIYWWKGTD